MTGPIVPLTFAVPLVLQAEIASRPPAAAAIEIGLLMHIMTLNLLEWNYIDRTGQHRVGLYIAIDRYCAPGAHDSQKVAGSVAVAGDQGTSGKIILVLVVCAFVGKSNYAMIDIIHDILCGKPGLRLR